MNWTMGRYINELDTEGRDRLIGAPEFGFAGLAWGVDGEYGRERPCLVDAATGRYAAWQDWTNGPVSWGCTPSYRWDRACVRFGLPRVVRAIKLRAAKLNGCDADTIRKLLETPVPAAK